MSRRTAPLRRIAWATAAVLGAIAGTAIAPPATAAAASGTLAFTSFRDGAAGVYAVNADGSAMRRLTHTPGAAFEGSPAFSPDGLRIAYVCGNFELCVMNADGSAQTRVTSHDWPRAFRYDRTPAWSPDGTRLAFTRTEGGRDAIWIVNLDGSGLRRLPVPKGFNTDPSFSADGTKIAFGHAEALSDDGFSGSADIYVIGVDGSALRKLTSEQSSSDPAWSPDGSRIAFVGFGGDDDAPGGGNDDIFVMNADGTAQRQVTKGRYDEAQPAWSPDASRIAFASTRKRTHLIYEVASTGGAQKRLTSGRGPDFHPAWQPAGVVPDAGQPTPAIVPPSIATADAQVVASLAQIAFGFGQALAGDPLAGGRKGVDNAVTRTRSLAKRIGTTVRALRPSTSRGRQIRRIVLQTIRSLEAVTGDLRAASRSLRRDDRRAARGHAKSALGKFLGIGFGLAEGQSLAGAPQGTL